MPVLTDIHTHHLPAIPGTALVNVRLKADQLSFIPQQGQVYSVGLHPWDVGNRQQYQTLLKDSWEKRLTDMLHCEWVLAVGEAGFDKLCSSDPDCQYNAFVIQAKLAEMVAKPLIIHQVKGIDRVLAVHKLIQPKQPWIIHGFRGKPQQALALAKLGFYLSFGERYNEESLRTFPHEYLLLETDESLIPIETLYEKAAQVRGLSASALRKEVLENIHHIFPALA